jgi:hypothetical protein
VGEQALARAAGPDERDDLARGDVEVHAGEAGDDAAP